MHETQLVAARIVAIGGKEAAIVARAQTRRASSLPPYFSAVSQQSHTACSDGAAKLT
ncbi:hypothetical protein [uncultured Hoeflea sp.]|uniref:hypothetical protein n=1 Tax=uncultured Hoeflea sp. TaxID=538666 RepID=UPI0030DB266A